MNDQDEVVADLIESLSAGECVCVTGAGSSKPAGMPLWPELIDELCEHFDCVVRDSAEDLMDAAERVVADILERGEEARFHDFLWNRFKDGTVRSLHEGLASMPFRGYATLNYDEVLEAAVNRVRTRNGQPVPCQAVDPCHDYKREILDFMRQVASDRPAAGVLHFHGHRRHPEHLILTRSDYERSYEGNPLHCKVIWQLLANYTVVFVGVGLRADDPYFEGMLRTVRADFGAYDSHLHYALTGASSDEDRERKTRVMGELSVRPVFYEIQDGRHSLLEDLVDQLRRSAGIEIPALDPTPEEISRRMMTP